MPLLRGKGAQCWWLLEVEGAKPDIRCRQENVGNLLLYKILGGLCVSMSVLLLRKKSGFPVFVLVFNNVSGGVVHLENMNSNVILMVHYNLWIW